MHNLLMGEEVANTMMEHLPPSGWSDVARKSDIGHLQKSIDSINVQIEGIRTAQWTLAGITIICFVAQTAWIYNAIQ